MPAIVQRGSTSNIGISIENMSYPMGEDVPEVFYKMVSFEKKKIIIKTIQRIEIKLLLCFGNRYF